MEGAVSGGDRPTILLVDDVPDNITALASLLKDEYRTRAATSGERALAIATADPRPDLILLDVVMPDMDGYEVCTRLKAEPATAEIPVIFITARSEVEDETRGLALGAVDYIVRPISPPIVRSRVRTHLQLKAARDFLRDKSAYLEREVERRTREIAVTQDATMVAMGSLAETRDNETGNHIRRTQHYMEALALVLRDHPRFSAYLTPEMISILYKSAPLHDIGKVGIPDAILLKPGKLTPEEFDIMKTHTVLGRDAILSAEKLLDSPNTFLSTARDIAWSHHEKWDGSGYPRGLSGDGISIVGRLMAVVDVFDALTSRRVYKPASTAEEALRMIADGKGTHFDPDVADAFFRIGFKGLGEIAARFADHGS
jgi:putative two-component system response regulator